MTTKETAGKDAGFSLVEAVIAVLVFIIGIAAISNLFLQSITANSTANVSAATAAVASEVMDRLRSMPSNTLAITPGTSPGTPLTNAAREAILAASATDSCSDTGTVDCVSGVGLAAKGFVLVKRVEGVGLVHAKWTVESVGNGTNLFFITVRAQTMAPVVGERANAEFTSFRY
jgi:hypothetical protein